MKSIKWQLVITTTTICFLSVLITVLLNFVNMGYSLTNETINGYENTAVGEAEIVSRWITSQAEVVDTLATTFDSLYQTGDYDDGLYVDTFKRILTDTMNKHPYYVDLYTLNQDSFGVFGSDYVLPEGWDVNTRDWYQDTMADTNSVNISEPYVDINSGSTVITISTYIGDIDGRNTVLGADIIIDELIATLHNIVVFPGSYAALISESGDVIAHTVDAMKPVNGEMISLTKYDCYSNLLTSLDKEVASELITDYDGVNRYIVNSNITSTGWTVLYSVPLIVVNEPFFSLIATSAALIVVGLLISSTIIYFMSIKLVVKPIKVIHDAADKLAVGNLNFDLTTDEGFNSKNEFGELQRAFHKMQSSINSLITDITYMSNEQEKGNSDSLINAEEFEGAYNQVANGVNTMMVNLLGIMNEIFNILGDYSRGNFSSLLRELPGDQISITETVNNFRTQLVNVSSNINTLVEGASQGNLHARINTEGYQGDWEKLFSALNNLMTIIAKPIEEAEGVITEISKGNLSRKVQGEYAGSFNHIKIALNETVDELASYIGEIRNSLHSLSQKDLSIRIDREYRGEFVTIRDAINEIAESWTVVVEQIKSSTEQVHTGANQIASTSMDLANGAVTQSTSIQTLGTVIQEINDQAISSAENAKNADQLSITSKEIAVSGGEDMSVLVQTMDQIKDSSESIKGVLAAIEDISFQTNLLALNANVEAARAGEHGKGFAVVADEVRTLALRSQGAAKQSNEFIETSNTNIASGVTMADATNKVLDDIVEAISEVAEIITHISDSANIQANSVTNVMDELEQISNIAHANTATSEETAAASEELLGQADILNQMMSEFKI